jgi:hypothetical protein
VLENILITKIIKLHVRQVLQYLNYCLSWGGKIKETLGNVLTRETIAVISLHIPRSEVKINSMLHKLFS